MLFRKIVLDKANFFDPDFFIYCEELKLCNRINSHGYKVFLKVIKKPFMSTKEVKPINLRRRTNLMHPSTYLFQITRYSRLFNSLLNISIIFFFFRYLKNNEKTIINLNAYLSNY